MKILKPIYQRKIKTFENDFFVFDVETTCLSPMPKNFVFGVVYGWNYHKVIYTVEEFIEEFKHKRYKKKTIFAHNAEFDLTTVFGNIYEHVDSAAVFDGKFICAQYGTIRFADSLNIFPTGLAVLGEILGKPKLENDKVKDQGLTKDNITQEDITYCIRDCEIIFDSLLNMFNEIGTIKLTIASISMYTFRKFFLEQQIVYSDLVDEFFNSYYGGRTEAFKIGKCKAKVYDINSLYPYCMDKVTFPDTKNLKKEINIPIKKLLFIINRYEGLAKVKVKHHDTYIGFLPFREDKGKLLFPVGTFETTINFNELRFALDHNAIDILECEYIVYANAIESPFKSFVQTNYNLRKNSKNEFEKYKLKLILNSNYGKWAQRSKNKTEYYKQLPHEIVTELQKADKFYQLKMFSKDRDDCFLVTENEEFKKSFFAIPLFSSYITSHARITLLKGLLQNKDGVVYCDTDSVFTENDFVGDVGNDLGQFKLENKTVTEIRGLKNYRVEVDGKPKEVIKGVRKGSIKIGENKYKSIQYFKTREALRRNKESGDIKETIKEIRNIYDKRLINEDGTTKPIILNS